MLDEVLDEAEDVEGSAAEVGGTEDGAVEVEEAEDAVAGGGLAAGPSAKDWEPQAAALSAATAIVRVAMAIIGWRVPACFIDLGAPSVPLSS